MSSMKLNNNPTTPGTFQIIPEGNEDNPLLQFLQTDSAKKKILNIIRGLHKGEDLPSLDEDENPLDNIIREEIRTFLNFRRLSKSKIKKAKMDLTKGEIPTFSQEELIILINQALSLEYINTSEHHQLLADPMGILSITYATIFKQLLDFQESLPNNIPTLEELEITGIVSFILDTVRNNPEAVIDEFLIKQYTEQHIDNILLSSDFLGYTKASNIYANPGNILLILSRHEFREFARRVGLYLKFVTEEKINLALGLMPSQHLEITRIFSPEQIRMMIDKELDIKNLILKAMSIKDIEATFRRLADEFTIAFEQNWTEERLENIVINTFKLYTSEPTLEEIYANVARFTNSEINYERLLKIEDELAQTEI